MDIFGRGYVVVVKREDGGVESHGFPLCGNCATDALAEARISGLPEGAVDLAVSEIACYHAVSNENCECMTSLVSDVDKFGDCLLNKWTWADPALRWLLGAEVQFGV